MTPTLSCVVCRNLIEPSRGHLRNPETLERVCGETCRNALEPLQCDSGRWVRVPAQAAKERAA